MSGGDNNLEWEWGGGEGRNAERKKREEKKVKRRTPWGKERRKARRFGQFLEEGRRREVDSTLVVWVKASGGVYERKAECEGTGPSKDLRRSEAAEQFCPETDAVLRAAGAGTRPAYGGGHAQRRAKRLNAPIRACPPDFSMQPRRSGHGRPTP